jgi:uncharacterized protein (TIRG00374 family)
MTDGQGLLRALSQVGFLDIVNLLLLSGALILVSAVKWGLFLSALSQRVPTIRLVRLYLIGYFVNLLMPSYLGGDVVRSLAVGRTMGQHEAFAATVLERYTGLVAMLFLALIFVWWAPAVPFLVYVAVVILNLGAVVLTLCALSERSIKLLRHLPGTKGIVTSFERLQRAFHLARGNSTLLVRTFGLSLLYHCLTVVNTAVAACAVGWCSYGVFDLFSVLPLILLIGAIPVSPQGLGIQEGAFTYFLSVIGATPEQAIGVAVVLRAKSYVLALIGGLLWPLEKGR